MGVVGTLLKNRRAGEAKLAWNLPNLSAPEPLTLTSDAFGDGEAIPAKHAGKRAGGRNLSPQLAWSAPPAGTAELLLVVEDADAPMPRPFVHCVALIEPQVRELPSGALAARSPAAGVRVLRSGMGRGYLGPEPIKGHGPHRYTFQLFALATAAAAGGGAAAEQARPRALLPAVSGPVLAKGRLTGIYER
jgi:Raf kinase inhibitor-like YbhB/YbcL family protein